MDASRELPRYQSHKEVWALKIKSIVRDGDGENRESNGTAIITPEEDGYAPFEVDAEYMHKHKPLAGGYYVVCKDGYVSYSPPNAFEEGNIKLPGDFKSRLKLERMQLIERTERLEEYLKSDESNQIDQFQLAFLGIQLPAMKTYLRCLDERFGRL